MHAQWPLDKTSATLALLSSKIVIQEWKNQGDHIIVSMDANEDVRRGEVFDLILPIGLREVILELHQDKSPPATHTIAIQAGKLLTDFGRHRELLSLEAVAHGAKICLSLLL